MSEQSDNLLRNLLETTGGHHVLAAAPQFVRPADVTAYAIGDLVANSTVAGAVTALVFATAGRIARNSRFQDPKTPAQAGSSGRVLRARLKKSTNVVAAASFRLHLYTVAPVVTNGDNGAWLSSGAAGYLGHLDITVDKAFSDGANGHGAPGVGQQIAFALAAGTTLYGLLEARGAYTPGNAETFDVTLEVCQD